MIKPDGVRKGLVDEIVSRIQRTGLKITSTCRLKFDRELAERLYSVHKGKPFFEKLVNHVLSGEVVVMAVEGGQSIARIRELIGSTIQPRPQRGLLEAISLLA